MVTKKDYELLKKNARKQIILEQSENAELKSILINTLWMARRYADGRKTYAVGLFNENLRKAKDIFKKEWEITPEIKKILELENAYDGDLVIPA